MRRKNLPILAALIFLPILSIACESKMLTAYNARRAVNDAGAEVLALHSAGGVSNDGLRITRDAIFAAEPALDELDRAAIANDDFRWPFVLWETYRRTDEALRAAAKAKQ